MPSGARLLVGAVVLMACDGGARSPSPPEAEALRARMRMLIWGERELPRADPPLAVRRDISSKHFVDVPNLASVDELTFDAGLGLRSVVYHLHPRQSNRHLVLYHEGHGEGFLAMAQTTINRFIADGFSVMAFDMPLTGVNEDKVAVVLPDGTRYVPRRHDDLKRAEAAGAPALAPFFTPLAAALAYSSTEHRYEGIAMVGLSGGGWTTHVYSALDPRVQFSYPVAGHVSNELKRGEKGPGDFEQNLERPLYRAVDFETIFFLGAAGEGRRQLQILNKYDTCCFWTRGRRPLFDRYQRRIQGWLGDDRQDAFEIYEDATHKGHRISAHALDVILKDLHERWEL